MDSKTYVQSAVRTESVPASININQTGLHAAIELAIACSVILDQVKRKIFYGKAIEAEMIVPHVDHMIGMANFIAGLTEDGEINDALPPFVMGEVAQQMPEKIRGMSLNQLDIRLLHAGLGVFTEAGEVLEALQKQYETGVLDYVNFGEEMGGDISWYQAIAMDRLHVNLDDEREKNIAKLKARFPNAFDADKAINRDLATERAILEG